MFPDGLPDYVMQAIKNIMFGMLANPQLSIRETATRAISAALSRSQFKEALDAFQEVVSELQGSWTSADLEDAEQRKDRSQFMNAYQAEGLLGVCLFIIKNIPPGFLLPEWPRYFSIFELYLTHPASTVRQATSAIFKYIGWFLMGVFSAFQCLTSHRPLPPPTQWPRTAATQPCSS